MCYLYDTLHEIFEAKELNVKLFKEFIEKYKDKDIAYYAKEAVRERGWVTKELEGIYADCYAYDENGKVIIENIYIIDFIKIDDVNNFIDALVDQKGELRYELYEIFIMIFYYNSVKCLKYMLLQKDKDYFGKYINEFKVKYFRYDVMLESVESYIAVDPFKTNKFRYISTHTEIIKTIRTVIGFSELFETMLLETALHSFNFNVIKSVENECKLNNNTVFLELMNCHSESRGVCTLLYKESFSKRDLYALNEYCYLYKIAKEYIDYLCEVTFDKDYDKELMGIVIACMRKNIHYNILFNIDFFKKYHELFAAAFFTKYCNIDLKNNSIYNMLPQMSKDLIDIFVSINKLQSKNDDFANTMLKNIFKRLNEVYNIVLENDRKVPIAIIVRYKDLFNSAFKDIL